METAFPVTSPLPALDVAEENNGHVVDDDDPYDDTNHNNNNDDNAQNSNSNQYQYFYYPSTTTMPVCDEVVDIVDPKRNNNNNNSNTTNNNNNNNNNNNVVDVVAPCNLEEGFTFLATIDGYSFPVVVPEGGVKEGQRFSVPFQSSSPTEVTPFFTTSSLGIYGSSGTGSGSGSRSNQIVAKAYFVVEDAESGEYGRWKDGLFGCCSLGVWHPTLWIAFTCPQILMGQVLTRMQLNWVGDNASGNTAVYSSNEEEWRYTFRHILLLVCGFWLVTVVVFLPTSIPVFTTSFTLTLSEKDGIPILIASLSTFSNDDDITSQQQQQEDEKQFVSATVLQISLFDLVALTFGIYTLIVLFKLRRNVRVWYDIPPLQLWLSATPYGDNPPHPSTTGSGVGSGFWEDLCITLWCGCCSVAQMARQTAEYDQQAAACCSPTGLGHRSTSFVVDATNTSPKRMTKYRKGTR